MSKARLAMALWILLAIIVFNVRFDWQSRVAGHNFVSQQLARVQQGQPPLTINEGYRPMVRAAAMDGAIWMLVVAAAGGLLTLGAVRFNKSHA